jgi:hypothetical protein
VDLNKCPVSHVPNLGTATDLEDDGDARKDLESS